MQRQCTDSGRLRLDSRWFPRKFPERESPISRPITAAGVETYLLRPHQDIVLLAPIDEARAKAAQVGRRRPS